MCNGAPVMVKYESMAMVQHGGYQLGADHSGVTIIGVAQSSESSAGRESRFLTTWLHLNTWPQIERRENVKTQLLSYICCVLFVKCPFV